MSSSDDRIVRLRLDNDQFERGAEQSIRTTERMKEALEFKDATKGFREIEQAANDVKLDAIASSLEKLEHRFSTVGEIGANVLHKITDGALQAAKSIEQATIGQIKTGGWNRAMNIANARFRISGLGYEWEPVYNAANYAVSGTAYGLDVAANAASQLAASGIDFENVIDEVNGEGLTAMHKSLRAISGVAAMTNTDFQSIAEIFTSVAGRGRLQQIDLNRIAIRGINAAAALAKAIGVDEADIRDMTRQGLIDFETFAFAMDDAFGEHAKKANDTLTGSISNTKAALSRIGALFAQPIVDKTNVFFNALTGQINNFKSALSDIKDEDGNTILRFAGHFEEFWSKFIEYAADVVSGLDLSWFQSIADGLDSITVGLTKAVDVFSARYKEVQSTLDAAEEIAESATASIREIKAAYDIWFKGSYGNGDARAKALEKAGLSYSRVQGYLEDSVIPMKNTNQIWKDYAEITKQASEGSSAAAKSVKALNKNIGDIPAAAKDAAAKAGAFDSLNQQFIDISEPLGYTAQLNNSLDNIPAAAKEAAAKAGAFDSVANKFVEVGEVIEEAVEDYADPIENLVIALLNLKDTVANLFTSVANVVKAIVSGFRNVFGTGDLALNIRLLSESLLGISEALLLTEEKLTVVQVASEIFFSVIKKITDFIGRAIIVAVQFVEYLITGEESLNMFGLAGSILAAVLSAVVSVVRSAVSWIADLILNFQTLVQKVSQTSGFQRLAAAFASLRDAIASAFGDKFSRFAEFIQNGISSGSFLPTIDDIAEAIGWVADKLAVVVEQLPVIYNKVKDFLTNVWDAVKGFFDKIGLNKEGLTSFKDTLVGIFTGDISVVDKIKEFAHNIGSSIYDALSSINWGDVAQKAGIAGGLLSLFACVKIMWGIATFLDGIAAVPMKLALLFGNIASVFKSVSRAITFISSAYAIAQLALAFVMIGGMLIALSQVPTYALDNAVSAMVIMSILFIVVNKMMTTMATVNVSNIKLMAAKGAKMAGQGLLIAGIAAAIALIIVALKELTNVLANADESKLSMAFLMITGAMMLILLFIVTISKLMTKVPAAGSVTFPQATMLISLSFIITAVGKAIARMAEAMSVAKDVPPGVIGSFIGLLATFMSLVAVILLATAVTTPGKTFGVTILLLALSLMMVTMIYTISAFSSALGLLDVASIKPKLKELTTIVAVILGMAALIILVGGISAKIAGRGNKNPATGILLMLTIMIAVIAFATSKLAKTSGSVEVMNQFFKIVVALGAIMAVLAIIAAVATAKGVDVDKNLKSISDAFLGVAIAMAVLAAAFYIMGRINYDRIGATIGIMLAFIVIVAALGVVANLSVGGKTIGEGMMAFGKALMYAGIGAALFGVGMLLVNAALILLGKNAPIVAFGMEAFFSVLEKHWVTVLIFTAVVVALVVAIVAFSSAIGRVLAPVGTALKTFFTGLGSAIKTGAGKIGTWFKGLSNRGKIVVVGLIATLCAALMESGPTIAQTIGKLILNLVTFLGSIIGDLANAIVVLIVKLLFGIARAIRQNSSSLLAAIGNIVMALVDLLLQALMKIGAIVINLITIPFRALLSAVDWAMEKFEGDDWTPLADALGAATDDYTKSIEAARNEMSLYFDEIATESERAGQEADDLKRNYHEAMTDVANDTAVAGFSIDTLKQKAVEAFGAAETAVSQYTEALNKNLEVIPAAAKEAATKAGAFDPTTGMFVDRKSITDYAADYFNFNNGEGFDTYLKNQMGDFSMPDLNEMMPSLDADSLMGQDFMDGLNFNFDNINDSASMFGEDFTSIMGQNGTDASEAFDTNFTLADDVEAQQQKAVDDSYDYGEKTGSRYGDGINTQDNKDKVVRNTNDLIAGMTDAFDDYKNGKAKGVMKDLCDSLASSFEKENMIHSPSKRYRKLAGYVVSGITTGIRAATPSAAAEMGSLSDCMIVSFGAPLDMISAMVAGGLDYNPAISPVVDMANVNSASGGIRSAFENQNVTLTGLSGQIAADVGTLNDSNMQVVEEIRAMRSEMNEMTRQIDGMKVVMDSGALVGQITAPLDRSLGLRARIRGRG